MPVGSDAIGTRGEGFVTNLLTRRHGHTEPYFRPPFLGGKYPAIDFFVGLLGATTPQTPYFLVQVKSTSGGYTQAGRLRARVTPSGMNSLVKYPAPTLPTTFPLDQASTLRFLHLAKIFLTRRDELDEIPVSRSGRSLGYDVLVRVQNGDSSVVPEFAVSVRGVRNTSANRVKSRRFLVDAGTVGYGDRPVVLFVFDVDTETGFYQWLNEPVIDEDGRPVLRPNGDLLATEDAPHAAPIPFTSLRTLNNEAIDIILRSRGFPECRPCNTPHLV